MAHSVNSKYGSLECDGTFLNLRKAYSCGVRTMDVGVHCVAVCSMFGGYINKSLYVSRGVCDYTYSVVGEH